MLIHPDAASLSTAVAGFAITRSFRRSHASRVANPVHALCRGILPESPVNEQSSQQILDLYTAGYFCHPLRGILSMRESLAFYDFRQWMDLEQHPRVRGLVTRETPGPVMSCDSQTF